MLDVWSGKIFLSHTILTSFPHNFILLLVHIHWQLKIYILKSSLNKHFSVNVFNGEVVCFFLQLRKK